MYESGYTKNTNYSLSESAKEFQLTPETITVAKDEDEGTFTVTFPVKAYLKYAVYVDYSKTNGVLEGFYEDDINHIADYQNFAVNNKIITIKGLATIAGEYNIYVTAYPYNSRYFNGAEIKASNSLNYKRFPLPAKSQTADNITFNYKNETNLEISWQPAVLTDGSYAEPSQYKIYKTKKGSTNYEFVSTPIKVTYSATNTPIYKITDSTDGSSYKYLFVLTDGIKYAGVCSSETVEAYNVFVDSTDSSISIEWKDLDSDDLKNDAYVIISLADENKTLSAVTYGVADSNTDAADIAILGENELTISGTHKTYAFLLKNIVNKDGSYLFIRAKISENGKKDTYISNSSIYNLTLADGFSLYNEKINLLNEDDDGLFNDVSFAISALNKASSLNVTYAIADSAEEAKKLLDTSEAKSLVNKLTGYTFYEFNSSKYSILKNINLGKYIAFKVTASQTNKKSISEKYCSSNATYDAEIKTSAPIISSSLKALDDDRIANDLYATIEVNKNQKISKLYYATANLTEYDADSSILTYRLNTQDVTNISEEFSKKYSTEEKNIYEVTINDLEIGDYIALRAIISEDHYVDNIGTTSCGPVKEDVVVPEVTAAPVLSQNYIYFSANNSDANYNDIYEGITISIGIDQNIKAIEYAYAESKTKLNEYLRTDSTATTKLSLPSEYNLQTAISDNSATLTKVYDFWPEIWNIPDGNYAALKLTISEPGCLDYVQILYTKTKTHIFDYPVSETVTTGEVAAQKTVKPATLIVDDGKNWEYVHVTVKDYFNNDDFNNYEYKLERTLEKYYNNSETVWETIEDNISQDIYSDDGYYVFDKWYKDIPVGTYVYRLTKTRKAYASVTGKEESAVTDAAVNIVYHVELGALGFSDYSSENLVLNLKEYMNPNYDDINKYDYHFGYYVEYKTIYGDTDISSETEIANWSWTKEYNENGEETGYYILTNAIISEINRPDMQYARVYVIAYKERKIANYENTYKTTNVLLNWGITTSIASNSTLNVAADTSSDYIYIYVDADVGYDSYTWYLDGENTDSTYSYLNIYKNDLSAGTHEVVVVAKKGTIPYSATITITK